MQQCGGKCCHLSSLYTLGTCQNQVKPDNWLEMLQSSLWSSMANPESINIGCSSEIVRPHSLLTLPLQVILLNSVVWKLPNLSGNGNPLQYSCLENARDRGAWWAAVYGVAQSRTRLKRLSRVERWVSTLVSYIWLLTWYLLSTSDSLCTKCN